MRTALQLSPGSARAYQMLGDIYSRAGKTETAKGSCTLTSIYEDGRWWLCDSHFTGTTTSGLRFWF